MEAKVLERYGYVTSFKQQHGDFLEKRLANIEIHQLKYIKNAAGKSGNVQQFSEFSSVMYYKYHINS